MQYLVLDQEHKLFKITFPKDFQYIFELHTCFYIRTKINNFPQHRIMSNQSISKNIGILKICRTYTSYFSIINQKFLSNLYVHFDGTETGITLRSHSAFKREASLFHDEQQNGNFSLVSSPYAFPSTCDPILSSLYCTFYFNILNNFHIILYCLINSQQLCLQHS